MRSLSITAIAVLAALPAPLLAAPQASDAKTALEKQLLALYPLAGDFATRTGTILQVNKPKIGMLQNALVFSNSYKDGQIRQAFVSKVFVPQGTDTDIHVGDRVYLVKIEVKPKGKDPSIVFLIQACGNCDFTPVTTGIWRASVAFQFPQGALDQPDIATIRQKIGEVFTVAQATLPVPLTAPSPEPPGGAPVPPAQEPVNIQLGQTPDQVISMLGQPERKAAVGPKEIYFYKDMKITFQNGAVSDVQ
jgi:hypothetical protein